MESFQPIHDNVFLNPPTSRICLLGFDLDCVAGSAEYRGTLLRLSRTEFELLGALLASAGCVLSREHLSDCILRQPFHPLGRSLDMMVSRLRRKLRLEDNPGRLIRTIRSTGYMFAVPCHDLYFPAIFEARRPARFEDAAGEAEALAS